MYRLLLPLLLVVPVAMRAAEQRLNLDLPVSAPLRVTEPDLLRSCDLGLVVTQVGRALNIPVGFENTDDCWLTLRGAPGPDGEHIRVLAAVSPRQAFDEVVALMPRFSWREMDGIVVVRPKSAWDDPHNILNFRTTPFEARDTRPEDVLHTILHRVTPKAFIPHKDLPKRNRSFDERVTVLFKGGTMLDAVNELARVLPGMYWQLAYESIPHRSTIELGTYSSKGIILAPVALPKIAP